MKTTLRIHDCVRAAVFAVLAAATVADAQELKLPNKDGSVKFAVLGDWGTGAKQQYEVGEQMAAFHTRFPFTFVITTGDNIYGTDRPEDFRVKFELPYKTILGKGVKFQAVLGNHDNPTQRFYQPFNMGGQRFYTFRGSSGGVAKLTEGGVRFFMLDSNYMDKAELDWLAKELGASGSDWKIAVFHHPLYSSGGRHGSSLDLRAILEPVLVQGGVNVVFNGHDHVYERVKPQKGIHHFVSGSGGSLRKGDLDRSTGLTDSGYDSDFTFMLIEIEGDNLHFQSIDRLGKTVDAGVVKRPTTSAPAQPAAPPVASPVPVPAASPVPNPPPTPAPSPTPRTPATGPAPTPDEAAAAAMRSQPVTKPSPSPSPSPR
jgi:calcineurin-like phosphoesterase family protein